MNIPKDGTLTKDADSEVKLFKGRQPKYVCGEWESSPETGTELLASSKNQNLFRKYRVLWRGDDVTDDYQKHHMKPDSLLIVLFRKKNTKCVIRLRGLKLYYRATESDGDSARALYTADIRDAAQFNEFNDAQTTVRWEATLPEEPKTCIERITED